VAKLDSGRIVVRRKRVYGESSHGGSWKIAYADFMTAMMAFFLVMWLLMLVPTRDLKIIAEYFRMPLMTAISGGPNIDTSESVIPGGQPSIVPNTFPLPAPHRSDGNEDEEDANRLENLQRELENLIEHNPVLQQFRPQLLLDMTPDGLRIQILDQQNRPMFNTGSAIVQTYMRDILRELAPALSSLPNPITVSGHTDAMRYAAGDRQYSNWELSADRANAARRELVAGGLVENKIKRILGLADTVNLVKENPFAAVNRRISILVLNRRAERRIDEQNAAGQDEAELPDQSGAPLLPGAAHEAPTQPAADPAHPADTAPEAASGSAPGAGPDAASGNGSGAAPGNGPGAASGNGPGTASRAVSGSAAAAVSGAASGAASGMVSGAAPTGTSGAAAGVPSEATPGGAASGAAPGGTAGRAPGTGPGAAPGGASGASAGRAPGTGAAAGSGTPSEAAPRSPAGAGVPPAAASRSPSAPAAGAAGNAGAVRGPVSARDARTNHG